MKSIQKEIDERLQELKKAVERFRKSPERLSELHEVVELLRETDDLVVSAGENSNCDGCDAHPLGKNPFLTAQILFNLDRCETLIKGIGRSSRAKKSGLRDSDSYSLLYPTIMQSILLRLFSFLIYCRGRLFGYEVCYDWPMISEIVYLKSPFWLAPLTGLLLPKRRRRWHSKIKK